jgi:hypothetical protein
MLLFRRYNYSAKDYSPNIIYNNAAPGFRRPLGVTG